MKHDGKMFEVLGKLSAKIANDITGKHLSFCWEVVNTLFGSIPEYSAQFKLNQYTAIIESTGIIARSRFTEWFSLNVAKFHLTRKKVAFESPYIVWVSDCFETILQNLVMMEEEKVDYGGTKTIYDKTSTMNRLLRLLMPKDIAQKLEVEDSKLKQVVNEFEDSRVALCKLLIRNVPQCKHAP